MNKGVVAIMVSRVRVPSIPKQNKPLISKIKIQIRKVSKLYHLSLIAGP
jgi:hypothetical protein